MYDLYSSGYKHNCNFYCLRNDLLLYSHLELLIYGNLKAYIGLSTRKNAVATVPGLLSLTNKMISMLRWDCFKQYILRYWCNAVQIYKCFLTCKTKFNPCFMSKQSDYM